MPRRIEKPLATRLYSNWDSFEIGSGNAYLYGTSVEARSSHPEEWETKSTQAKFVRIWSSEDPERQYSECSIEYDGARTLLSLRDGDQLRAFVAAIPRERLYLDVTGLNHSVWASLLKAAVETGKPTSVVYVEPAEYRFSKTPTEAEIFDLSEEIHGIRALPGFASLAEPESEDAVVFVPLLGFEGRRLAYVLEQVQPPIETTIPVLGVPGFRPEYPFHTYLGNRSILKAMHTRIRYVIANSASDVFILLQEIAESYPRHLLKIAPIGTKPHAVGAVLFALHEKTKRRVELIYDHPIRKPRRTTGSASILVYSVGCILGT